MVRNQPHPSRGLFFASCNLEQLRKTIHVVGEALLLSQPMQRFLDQLSSDVGRWQQQRCSVAHKRVCIHWLFEREEVSDATIQQRERGSEASNLICREWQREDRHSIPHRLQHAVLAAMAQEDLDVLVREHSRLRNKVLHSNVRLEARNLDRVLGLLQRPQEAVLVKRVERLGLLFVPSIHPLIAVMVS